MPLFFWPDTIGLGTLQRLSALLPSTASSNSKLEACGLIADSRTRNVLGETKKSELAKKLKLGLQWCSSRPLTANVHCEIFARLFAQTEAQSTQQHQARQVVQPSRAESNDVCDEPSRSGYRPVLAARSPASTSPRQRGEKDARSWFREPLLSL